MLYLISRPTLFRVRGASMEPSFYDGDLLLAASPRRAPARGQNVIIRMPESDEPGWRLKRVVGLPGERIVFEDGLLFINGTLHPEPYLRGLPAYLGLERMAFDVGEDRYFVLGDNRAHSVDSRSFGAIGANRITWLVTARLWPPLR